MGQLGIRAHDAAEGGYAERTLSMVNYSQTFLSCASLQGKCGESWMRGFCECSCGASAGGGGGGGNAAETSSLKALNIKTTANAMSAPLKSYGAQYQTNKRKVVAALRKKDGIGEAKVKLLIAIAMLETNTMDPAQRDTGKTGDSTNYSLWNINRDMLKRLPGGTDGNLNSWSGLDNVVDRLASAINKFGINGFLNFHRGGYTGWQDGVSYGCQDYRNGIASMIRILDNNEDLLSDSRRIDMSVGHV